MKQEKSDLAKEEADEKLGILLALRYATISAAFTLIGVLGLFLGYVFSNAPLGNLLAGGEPILHGSLFGVLIEVFRGSIALPVYAGAVGLAEKLRVLLYFMIFALGAAIVASFALTVLAFLRTKAARTLCIVNGYVLLLIYGALSALTFLLGALIRTEYSWRILDAPTAFSFLLLFLLFAALAIAERKWRGAANCLLFLMSVTGLFAFAYPNTPFLNGFRRVFSETDPLGGSLGAMIAVFAAITAGNLLLSVLRLLSKDSFLCDAVRFALQLLAGLLILFAFLAEGTSLADFFTRQIITAVFLYLPPLACLLFSSFCASLSLGKNKEQKEETNQKEETGAPEPSETPDPHTV